MAGRENEKARLRKVDPRALAILDLVDIKVRESSGSSTISPTLTEDMTKEEQIMALIEKYIKEGATLAEAERKAEGTLAFLESF